MSIRGLIRALIFASLGAVLTGCNFPDVVATAPAGPATFAARTVEVILTGASAGTQPPEFSPAVRETPAAIVITTGGTESSPPEACTNQATFVDDITVRDNSQLAPEAEFVKIWRLQNSGSCTWSQAYALAFFGGQRMDAPALVPLTTKVMPGSDVDLAVDLVAPPTPGTYQGFWKMRDGDGAYFGIGPSGDQSFWVKIVVAQPEGSLTPAPSSTPTPAPTPVVYAKGNANLSDGDTLDLDSGGQNPPEGADLRYGLVSSGEPSLTPLDGAKAGPYGPAQPPPTLVACQGTPLSADPVPATALATGALVCYQTGDGRFGFLKVTGANASFSIDFTTWAP